MMRLVMNKGELVWLPAATTLLRFDEAGTANKHRSTERPMNVFLVEKYDDVYWKILCDGEQWCVPKNLLFPPFKEV